MWKYFKQQAEASYRQEFAKTSSSKKKKKKTDSAINTPYTASTSTSENLDKIIVVKEEWPAGDEDQFYFSEQNDTCMEEEEEEEEDQLDDGDDDLEEDGMYVSPCFVTSKAEAPKSKVYKRNYESYKAWKVTTGAGKTTSEALLLQYFKYLIQVKRIKAPLQTFGYLKKSLFVYDGLSIGSCPRVKAYINKASKSIVRKQIPIMTHDQMIQFINEAPDTEQYVTTKVVVALWIAGLTNADEIHALNCDNVLYKEGCPTMEVRGVGPAKKRRYFIQPKSGYDPLPMIGRYLADREGFPHLLRTNSHGTIIRTGVHSIRRMPKVVAKFLNLPDADSYSSPSVREGKRKSAKQPPLKPNQN